MKKIFVLLMAGSLLAFAGAAFGADAGHVTPTPTPDEPVIVVPEPEEVPVVTVDPVAVAEVVAEKVKEIVATTVEALTEALTTAAANTNVEATATTVANLVSNISVTIQVVTADTITVNSTQKTEAEKTATYQSYARENKIVAGTLPKMTPKQGGVFSFPMPTFDRSYYGKKITWNPGRGGRSMSLAAVTDADGATFLDSNGTVTEVVPDGSTGATPGVVTVAANLQEGVEYDPAITVDAADVAEDSKFEAAIDTFEAKESTVNGTILISTYISDDIKVKLNITKDNLFEASAIGDSVEADSAKVKAAGKAAALGLFELKSPEAGTYGLRVNFASLYNAVSADLTTLKLDLGGSYVKTTAEDVEVAAEGNAKFYDAEGKEVTNSTPSGDGYVVFAVESKNYSPILTVDLQSEHKGSSSSGCNAGVAGLGMIPVAFALMALRRKSK